MQLLETLTQTAGVAGREHRLRDVILQHGKDLFDETYVDALGSLICTRGLRPAKKTTRRKNKSTRVMLAAHMDQIGFLVRHIETAGFLRLQNVGGFDTRNLFGRLVTVCPDVRDPGKDLTGVMNPAGRPIHIATEDDKKKVIEVQDLLVDLGLPPEDVKKKVKVGDMVVIRTAFARVGNTVVGQCLDNRVACWLALRAIEKLKHHDCEIIAAFTVQEEVGCRGAGPAADQIKPDIAIALDTNLCVDIPGVEENQRVTKQGDGAGLMVMDGLTISDLDLLEQFEQVAAKRKIKAQRSILPRGGTDAATIQRKASGYRAISLVCPTRYIHTVTEMIHLDDLHATRDLLAAYLEQA